MTKGELLKTIRLHCIDCCCGSYEEVEHCGCPTCNLYPLRFGKDPYKRELSPEQKARIEKMLLAKKKKMEESKAMEVSADATGA